MGDILLRWQLYGPTVELELIVYPSVCRDPFVMPISDQQRAMQNKVKLRFSNGLPSDQMVVLNALCAYEACKQRGEGVASRYCDDNFLSRSTLGFVCDLHRQVAHCLEKVTGISTHHPYTRRNNGNAALQCALIGMGLSNSVAIRKKGTTVFVTEKGVKAKVHPSSINKKHGSVSAFPDACTKNVEIVGYQELVASVGGSSLPGAASLMMLSTSPLSVFTFLISCGTLVIAEGTGEESDDMEVEGDEDCVEIIADKWLQLRTPRHTATLLVGLRECLYDALCYYLSRPTESLLPHIAAMVEGVVAAISTEHLAGSPSLQAASPRHGAGSTGAPVTSRFSGGRRETTPQQEQQSIVGSRKASSHNNGGSRNSSGNSKKSGKKK